MDKFNEKQVKVLTLNSGIYCIAFIILSHRNYIYYNNNHVLLGNLMSVKYSRIVTLIKQSHNDGKKHKCKNFIGKLEVIAMNVVGNINVIKVTIYN